MEIGKLITQYRIEAKLTIDDLSEKSGVPKGTLNKIIGGVTKSPTFANVLSIAKALGKTLNDFSEYQIENNTQQNKDLNIKYQALDEHGKYIVDLLLNAEYDRCTASK